MGSPGPGFDSKVEGWSSCQSESIFCCLYYSLCKHSNYRLGKSVKDTESNDESGLDFKVLFYDHPGDYLHTVPSPQQISACGKKMTPCFSGRKSCSSITMNQMEPSMLYDLVIHSSLLFLDHDHDFDNCQGALFLHFIIAKARTKLTGWQRAT